MMSAVTTALGDVIDAIGAVVTSIVGTNGDLKDLLPLLAIGVSISLFFVGIRAIRSIIWGA